MIDVDRHPADPAAAAAALQDLGFTLLDSDHPAAPGGARLLVALRDRPTLRHFDPEGVTCWVAAGGRGRTLSIDRRTPPGDRTVLWGHVHVVDRLGIENRFLTFGGSLEVADIDASFRVAIHRSPGPVVRWGGHSQGSDALAGEIGAFFGRLIVPVGGLPGGEARLAATPPEHLYAAYLRDAVARRREASDRGAIPRGELGQADPLAGWERTESRRVMAERPDWWDAAGRLLDDLDLGPEGLTSEREAAAIRS